MGDPVGLLGSGHSQEKWKLHAHIISLGIPLHTPPRCQHPHPGPQLDIPTNVSTPQLEILLNSVLKAEDGERVPYSFHIDEKEVVLELGAHLLENKVNAGLHSWRALGLLSIHAPAQGCQCAPCTLQPALHAAPFLSSLARRPLSACSKWCTSLRRCSGCAPLPAALPAWRGTATPCFP